MTADGAAVRCRGLVKRYEDVLAVDRLDRVRLAASRVAGAVLGSGLPVACIVRLLLPRGIREETAKHHQAGALGPGHKRAPAPPRPHLTPPAAIRRVEHGR